MADINRLLRPPTDRKGTSPATETAPAPAWDLIELLFFAYRAFVGDADAMLQAFDFGRAHHRVLHFVYRNPGMKVAELLDLLQITKQSLARVLKQLVDEGYIVQRTGRADRRQRLLYATPEGEALVGRLVALQTTRINHALSGMSEADRATVVRFLTAMMDQSETPDTAR